MECGKLRPMNLQKTLSPLDSRILELDNTREFNSVIFQHDGSFEMQRLNHNYETRFNEELAGQGSTTSSFVHPDWEQFSKMHPTC